MTVLTVVDLLRSGAVLRRADVLDVAEILAHHLAEQHGRGHHHGDIGPHTVALRLADPVGTSPASPGVQDAWLTEPRPAARPPEWPAPPEGPAPPEEPAGTGSGPVGPGQPTSGAPADIFALGQVLRVLDTAARSSAEETAPPAFVQQMVDADPTRRPTAQELLAALDEGRFSAASSPTARSVGRPAPTPGPERAHDAEPGRTWPRAVAAATVFVLVLAGGLWWTGRDDDPVIQDNDPAQADVLEEDAEPTTDPTPAQPTEGGATAEDPGTAERPRPGATLAPEITATSEGGPNAALAPQSDAEGDTEFDQAWCRSHGDFVARAQTNNYHAVICGEGDTLNYHGLNLIDGLTIRVPATEHSAGWTGHGEEDITYELSKDLFEVRQGDSVLASEEVTTFIDPTQDGDYRPWDLHVTEPISFPACRGAAIVVLDIFDNVQGVNAQMRESLEAHPGARYLNTDASCDSLGQPSHQRGNQFITYFWAGQDQDEVCELAEAYGTHALWLRDDVPPGEPVDCG